MTYAALELPDILLEVFLYLSQKDLLVTAQQVCQRWHRVISKSKALQEHLFFSQSSKTQFEVNPILEQKFPAFFDGKSHYTDVLAGNHNLGPWNTSDWARGSSQTNDTVPVLDPIRSVAYKRRDASWRRMIPCNPAPTELQVGYCVQGRAQKLFSGTFKSMSLEKPVTFGLLYDIAEAGWFQEDPLHVDVLCIDLSDPDPWDMTAERLQQSLTELFHRDESHIGGIGRVVLHLNDSNSMMCGHASRKYMSATAGEGTDATIFTDDFQCEDRVKMQDLKWDEEVEQDWVDPEQS